MKKELITLIDLAIQEDLPGRDVTSDCLFYEDKTTTAEIIAKQEGVFFGAEIIPLVCHRIDPSLSVSVLVEDGHLCRNQTVIATFSGSARQLLIAERTCLNFIQRLSGVATQTKRFVDALDDASIHLLDTRKTTPGFRELEKAAVSAGGGYNHRMSLSDMVLVKENHIAHFLKHHSPEAFSERLRHFKLTHPDIPIEVEIENPEDLNTYDLSSVDYILFDNFSLDMIHRGIQLKKDRGYRAEIEISGNVSLETISRYRGLDIQRISVGSMTHSVPAMDFSMLIHL